MEQPGLPAGVHFGGVLGEYAEGAFRSVSVTASKLRDWLGPHDARVYRFKL